MRKRGFGFTVTLIGLCLIAGGCMVPNGEGRGPTPITKLGPVITCQPIDDNNVWVVTEKAVFRTKNNGHKWLNVTPLSYAGMGDFKAVFLDHNVGHIAALKEDALDLEILKTVDGGQTWTSFNINSREGQMAPWPVALVFTDNDHGWLVTSYGVAMGSNWVDVYVTKDGGQSWQLAASGNPSKPGDGVLGSDLPLGGLKTGLGAADGDKAWMVGFSYADGVWLYNTVDGGRSWDPVELPLDGTGPIITWSPIFQDGQNGILPITFDSNGSVVFCQTSDGGSTWEPTVPVEVISHEPVWGFANSQQGIVADGYKLHRTDNGGLSWQQVDMKITNTSQLRLLSAERGWAISEAKLYRTGDGGRTWNQITK